MQVTIPLAPPAGSRILSPCPSPTDDLEGKAISVISGSSRIEQAVIPPLPHPILPDEPLPAICPTMVQPLSSPPMGSAASTRMGMRSRTASATDELSVLKQPEPSKLDAGR